MRTLTWTHNLPGLALAATLAASQAFSAWAGQCGDPSELARRFAAGQDPNPVALRTAAVREEFAGIKPGDPFGFTSAESGNTYSDLTVKQVVRGADGQIDHILSVNRKGQELRAYASRAKPGSVFKKSEIRGTLPPAPGRRLPARKIEEIAPDREYYAGKVFRQWNGAGGEQVPLQGWKLHVSATVETAPDVAEAILPELKRLGVPHKVASSAEAYEKYLLNPGADGNTQAGKFITIYPRSNEEARRLTRKMDEILAQRGLGSRQNDFIPVPGEARFGKTGGVYARYGSFTSYDVYRTDSSGHVLKRDGTLLLHQGKPIDINRPLAEDQRESITSLLEREAARMEDIRGQVKPDWVLPLDESP